MIHMAGLIHDIGKINVPAEILSRPGKLNAGEFALIKNHPETGYNILNKVDFPPPIAQIVYQHHEKMDGSGYPLMISGDQIILEARIITVADVVEAMAGHRPYRPALGIEKALDEIRISRGVTMMQRWRMPVSLCFRQSAFTSKMPSRMNERPGFRAFFLCT